MCPTLRLALRRNKLVIYINWLTITKSYGSNLTIPHVEQQCYDDVLRKTITSMPYAASF